MYLRDAKQAEVLLNQQENFLSKEEVPVSSTLKFDICFILLYAEFTNSHGSATITIQNEILKMIARAWY